MKYLKKFYINIDYSAVILSLILLLLILYFTDKSAWVPIVQRTLQWVPGAMFSLLGFALTAWAIVISLLDRGRVSAFKKKPRSWRKLSNSFKINAVLALLAATCSAFIDGLETKNEYGNNTLYYAILAFFEIAVFIQVLKVVHLLHSVAIAAINPSE